MSKRILTAFGAVLGALLLLLGIQQTVVATSAAWTDQVDFTATVSSGTWSTTPAPALLTEPSRGLEISAGPVLKVSTEVYNQKPTSGAGGTVNTLIVKITVPTAFLGDTASIAAPTGWSLTGAPVVAAGNQTFEFRRTTPIPLYQSSGPADFRFPLACEKGKKFDVPVLISSPEASNVLSFTHNAHILGWTC